MAAAVVFLVGHFGLVFQALWSNLTKTSERKRKRRRGEREKIESRFSMRLAKRQKSSVYFSAGAVAAVVVAAPE